MFNFNDPNTLIVYLSVFIAGMAVGQILGKDLVRVVILVSAVAISMVILSEVASLDLLDRIKNS